MKVNALKWLVIFAFWCPASAVYALALSDIELHSHLNRPLDARIGLTGIEEADLDGLNIRIHQHRDDNFQRTTSLRHEIGQDGNGWHIRVFTRDAVKEPILTFTLEVTWPQGSYSREYSLLIDPQ
ncbi:MAG: hypothetical protein WD750_11245 [Gammaproteobacteria bacterium]